MEAISAHIEIRKHNNQRGVRKVYGNLDVKEAPHSVVREQGRLLKRSEAEAQTRQVK